MKVRTRFAPSPTGNLHIGNIHTALYAWLFARKQGGVFILRIEDSDDRRSTKNAVEDIITGLNWLKLNWDEGPYFQTNKSIRYHNVINDMIRNGTAYKCYCSTERLRSLRASQVKKGEKPKYDGYCRIKKCVAIDCQKNISSIPCVIRFRNPQDGVVQFHDQIRGIVTIANKELDDLIICRTDGSPTYNFCVVVDDIDMNITHVIRGEEHISNTPRQINIFKALNASIPAYAHVSMILGHDHKKLSKRHGALGLMQYRSDGFLPEAILNYLVRLGWSCGDQEIFSIDQMKELFDFNTVGKSASVFNLKKLLWYNHYYINHLPKDYIVSHLSWHMHKNNVDINYGPELTNMVQLFSKRARTLKEMANNCLYFYKDVDISKDKLVKNYLNVADVLTFLPCIRKKIFNLIVWSPESIQFEIASMTKILNIDMHQLGKLLRVVLIGINKSPALSDIIYIIGKSRVLDKIDRAICVCST